MTDLRGEEGFTLTELMVGVMIVGVLSTATIGSLITIQRTLAGAAQRDAELGQARIAMNAVERQLRSAMPPVGTQGSPFLVTEDDEVEFYSAAGTPRDTSTAAPRMQGPVPRLVRLWHDGNQLWEQVTDPTWDAGSGTWVYTNPPRLTRALASDVVVPAGGIFTYQCEGGMCALTDRAAAIAVSIDLQVSMPGGSDASVLHGRARLVNREL